MLSMYFIGNSLKTLLEEKKSPVPEQSEGHMENIKKIKERIGLKKDNL